MYGGDPRIVFAPMRSLLSLPLWTISPRMAPVRLKPKSQIFTVTGRPQEGLSGDMRRTFSSFRSRWAMPSVWM